jgi:acetyl esterase/lipase
VDRPPFDPDLAAALEARSAEVVVSLRPEEIRPLRERAASRDDVVAAASPAFRTSVHTVPGAAGGPPVEVAVLRPTAEPGPVPCLLHLHGGGLVAGSMWDDVVPLLGLARQTGCAVVSVDYRLAPEHPYPAALDDARAALRWVVTEGRALGLRADAVVLEGVSAGGGLAAALALRARDDGGPRPAGQMLVCPMLDDRNDSASGAQMAGYGAWDRTANATAWRAYLGDLVGEPDVPPYAAPARAADLRGLPPTFVDVGSAETFRDEAVDLARRIWACGGDAELHVWPGGFHGFDHFAPDAPISADARAARVRWLRRLIARLPAGGAR